MRCNKSNNIDDLHEAALNSIGLMFVSKSKDLSVYHQVVAEVSATIATKSAEAILDFLSDNRAEHFQMSVPNFYYVIKRVKVLKRRIKLCKGKNELSKKICTLIDLSLKDFYKNRETIVKR